MSKKLLPIIVLLFSLNSFGESLDSLNQGFYVKISSHYHTPLTYQNSPTYFLVPFRQSQSSATEQIAPGVNQEFSLAKGVSYEFRIGKIYSNNLGFEIGINSLSSNNEYSSNSILMSSNFSSLYLKPAVVLAKNLKNSSILMKIGAIVSNSKLTQTYNKLVTYSIKPHVDLGYFMGIDYNLRLSKRIGFGCEIGIDNLFYTPQEATLDNLNVYFNYTSNIIYVDKYYSQIPANLNAQSYSSNNNSSITRLIQTTKLNSLYFGFGLNYNFTQNEKK